MDHRPYEDWLLDDERLTAEQERDLRAHLRNCPECAALERANMTLRAAPMSAPVPDFTARLQVRLGAERKARRWRRLIGWSLFVLIAVVVLPLAARLGIFLFALAKDEFLLFPWLGWLAPLGLALAGLGAVLIIRSRSHRAAIVPMPDATESDTIGENI